MNKKRQAIWDKSGGKCWYCGTDLPERGWHADHFEPIRRQPPKVNVEISYDENGWSTSTRIETPRPPTHPERDVESNKVPACASCNIIKGDAELETFRIMIQKFIPGLNARSTQYQFAKRYGLVQETGQRVVFWFEQEKKRKREEEANQS